MPKNVRMAVHIFLFVVAGLLLWAGLGAGLTLSPLLGSALWTAAGIVAALNFIWMSRSKNT